jgi:hypothetical protein
MTIPNQIQNPDAPIKHLRIKVFEAKNPEGVNRALNRFLDSACIEACNYVTHSLQDNGHRCSLAVVFGEPVGEDEPDGLSEASALMDDIAEDEFSDDPDPESWQPPF